MLEKLKAHDLTNESAYQRGYIDGKGSDTKRITELEAQNATLSDALKLALKCHGQMLLSDPPQEAWKYHRVEDVARAALAKQEVKT